MSKKKPGSFKGGRKPLAQRSASLDKDRDRKALGRAAKAGFATVAEHKASIAKKDAELVAERKANPTPPTFVQRIIANKPLARQLIAERGKDYAPVFNRVKRGPDGAPVPDPDASWQERVSAHNPHMSAQQSAALPTLNGGLWVEGISTQGMCSGEQWLANTAYMAGAVHKPRATEADDFNDWLHNSSDPFGSRYK